MTASSKSPPSSELTESAEAPPPQDEAPVSAESVSAEPVSAEPVSAEPVSAEPSSAESVSAEPVSGRGAGPAADTAPTNAGPKGGRGHWAGFTQAQPPSGKGPVGGRGAAPLADSTPSNDGPRVSGNAALSGSNRGG